MDSKSINDSILELLYVAEKINHDFVDISILKKKVILPFCPSGSNPDMNYVSDYIMHALSITSFDTAPVKSTEILLAH